MASQMYAGSICSEFSVSGIGRCNKCDSLVPFRSMSDHYALKHKVIEGEQQHRRHDVDEMENIAFPEPMSRGSAIRDTFFRTQKCRPGADEKENGMFALDSKEPTVDCVSPFADLTNDVDAAMPKVGRRPSRRLADFLKTNKTNHVFKPPTADDVFGSASDRKKIPTAFELFNVRSRSEFRSPKTGIDYASSPEDEHMSKLLPIPRRSVSMSRVPVIPENFEKCQFCLNIMHKDYLQSHIERQHYAEVEESTSKCKVGDDSTRNPHKKDRTERGRGKGKTTKPGKEKEGFIHCKICACFLHEDYLPGHLVRKHRTDHIGSIGVFWSQHTDQKMNEWLNDNRVYVKDGVFYVHQAEDDE